MLKTIAARVSYFVCCAILLSVAVYASAERFSSSARAAASATPTKTVYLTFDDGPSATTERVLAALEREGVVATFFVTAQYESYLPLLAKIDEAGHLVAPHSASHRFSKIYASSESFWADQQKILDIIFTHTAKTPAHMRFAGGSSNTASFPYGGRNIMKTLVRECRERSITYHDWNVDSGDWQNNRSADSIVKKVLTGVKNCTERDIVILFHDAPSAPNTPEALSRIIAELKAQGYRFGRLDDIAAPAHHGMP